MKDEGERPNILISHINLHDDESVHRYKPYNSKLPYNSHNTLCFPSKILHKQTVLPIRCWRFCRKTRFEASRVVFWSLSCYKELKLTRNRFTGRTLRGLLIQMQNISLRSSGMRVKQNLEFWGLKVTQQS